MKAIPTVYNKTKFKSKLEASYAKTLDLFKIFWVYEVNSYNIDGIKYLPDFWLPNINTFLEVKGPLVPGAEKTKELAKIIDKQNKDRWNPETIVIIGNEKGALKMANNNSDVALSQCENCKKYWFMPWALSFACRNCGTWDGDHHILKSFNKLTLEQMNI